MKICDTAEHGEIVHDDRKCPACEHIGELMARIEELEATVADLRNEVDA